MPQSEIKKFQDAAEDVASFFRPRLSGGINVKINTHTDPDGISAGNLMARALNYYDIPHHISFGGPPELKDLEALEKMDYDLFVFLDQGTGQFQLIEEHLLENDREVLILDHHPGEIRESPNLAHLNPLDFGIEGTKDVSSSGVVYSVLRQMEERFRPLSVIALVGALGDRQNLPSGFTSVNKEIEDQAVEEGHLEVGDGLKLNGRSLPLPECLSRSTRPFLLGLSGEEDSARKMVEDSGFDPEKSIDDLSPEEEKELRDEILDWIDVEPTESLMNGLWGTIYSSKVEGVVDEEYLHEYVTMMDACEKSDSEWVGLATLFGDEVSKEKAIRMLREYQERMISSINWFVSGEDSIKLMKNMRYVDAGDEVETGMMGEALSVAIESGIIGDDKPTIAVTHLGDDRIKVSARAGPNLEKSEKHIGEIMKTASEEFSGDGGGHKTAAAAHLPRESKEEFVEKVDNLLGR